MKSRAVFIIIGLMLVASGSMGIVLYEGEQRKQQDNYEARAADEQQKMAAEQNRAEGLRVQLEAERQRAQEVEQKLNAAEDARRKAEEKIRRSQEEDRLAKRKKDEEDRQAKKNKEDEERRKIAGQERQKSLDAAREQKAKVVQSKKVPKANGQALQPGLSPEQDRYMSEFEDRERAKEKREKTMYIRFELNPSKAREIRVAQIHAGDRVRIKVRRMVGADQGLYVGLAPLSDYRPGRGGSTVVATPIKDTDRFTISPDASFGADMARAIGSRDGAVLNIGVGKASAYRDERVSYGRRGFYLIELSIYSDNRWNIKPRSLL